MERAEKIGLGVALIGHLVLFAILSLNLMFRDDRPKLGDPTVEVTIAGDPGSSELLSDSLQPISQPEPVEAVPEEATSPIEELVAAPPEETAPPPPPQKTDNLPPDRSAEIKRQREIEARKKRETDARKKREADAKKRRAADAKAKRAADAKRKKAAQERRAKMAAAAKAAANEAKSGPPAKNAGQVRGEVNIAIGRQVKKYADGCTPNGIDVNKILTRVNLSINRSGALTGLSGVRQTGINDNNRPQAKTLEQCIVGAIRRASPFSGLDADYYDIWRNHKMAFQG